MKFFAKLFLLFSVFIFDVVPLPSSCSKDGNKVIVYFLDNTLSENKKWPYEGHEIIYETKVSIRSKLNHADYPNPTKDGYTFLYWTQDAYWQKTLDEDGTPVIFSFDTKILGTYAGPYGRNSCLIYSAWEADTPES